MAPRAYWKGYLRLSLVSCPIQLFPATSESEKISFNQINKETGNRVRYRKIDEGTGDEVRAENIVKAYQISKDQYLEFTEDELGAIAIESTRTIDIDQFVPTTEMTISITRGRTTLLRKATLVWMRSSSSATQSSR